MERVPEPELMNEDEQSAAYADADWSESHGKIPGYFRGRFPAFSGGRIIDLGCGPADVTVRFALAFPGVTALGVDGSDAMLSHGRRRLAREGLDSRIRLEKHYLPDPALETRAFDAVICNSLLHHIADPIALWRTAPRCSRAGAPILMVDLLRPDSAEDASRLVNEHAGGAPPVLRRDFAASLLAAYTIDEVTLQLRAAGLEHFQVERPDELHFIAWGLAND
jgi:ubiquinone/menaquinone biosynthesis C-methylase UbiE